MLIYYPPKVENYKKQLFNSVWNIYKKLMLDESFKIEVYSFEDKDLAIKIIKGYMDKGAYIFCHFTEDYEKLVIFKNRDTEKWLKEIKDKRDEKKEEK